MSGWIRFTFRKQFGKAGDFVVRVGVQVVRFGMWLSMSSGIVRKNFRYGNMPDIYELENIALRKALRGKDK